MSFVLHNPQKKSKGEKKNGTSNWSEYPFAVLSFR